ncbi:MAG: hypothetical protein IIY21_07710 [Clostridiales bacterium]|nr:hypothetical protein [Clostridiales bacterium]
MRVKFGNATKDVPIVEVTAENYIVPRGEEDTYHCKIEQTQYNPRNGKRLSRPRIQKFESKMYPQVARNLRQQGWDIEVLYDPTEFLAEREAKRAEMRDLTFKQRQELEAKREEEKYLKMNDKIIAELKAEGMIKEPTSKKGNGSKDGKKGEKTDAPAEK